MVVIHFANISVVSGGFLGALFAGFLAGYLVLGIKKVLSFLPQSLEGLKPTLLYPLLGIGLVGAILLFVNPFFGTINTGITNVLNSMGGTSRVMLGMVVAGMMAVDMGGPFNKAAYVFGTASLASGNFEVMDAVKAGGDRQELHERIRELSMEAGRNVKEKGLDNNLLELIAADPAFGLSLDELKACMEPSRYVGRAPKQVDEFLTEVVNPILESNKEDLGMTAEINV